MANPPTFNIPIKEFYKTYQCIDETGDIWEHIGNGTIIQVRFESDEYMVVFYR